MFIKSLIIRWFSLLTNAFILQVALSNKFKRQAMIPLKHCQILLLNFWLTVCHLFVLTGKEHTQTTVHCSQIKFSASRHCTLQQSEREGGRGANWPLHDKGLVCRYPLLFEFEVWHKSMTTTRIEHACARTISAFVLSGMAVGGYSWT